MSPETNTPPTPKDPISIARRRKQLVHIVEPSRKIALAVHLVTQGDWDQVLVFAGTKKSADELVASLEKDGISARAVHGNTGEDKSALALKAFNEGDARVIVTTDMIAKTMTFSSVSHVISLALPIEPQLYLERIGYLGESGRAVALVGSDEFNALYALERTLKRSIPQEGVEGFTTVAAAKEQSKPPRKPSGDKEGKKPFAKKEGRPSSKSGKKPFPPKGGKPSEKKNSKPAAKRTGKKILIKSLKPSEEEK